MLPQVLETVLAGLVLQIGSCHRLDERTRTGPRLYVGEVRLVPIPNATIQWILPQPDRSTSWDVLVKSVRVLVSSMPPRVCALESPTIPLTSEVQPMPNPQDPIQGRAHDRGRGGRPHC
jgi:hypothetical protein